MNKILMMLFLLAPWVPLESQNDRDDRQILINLDNRFLSQSLWDDGKAELAFYKVSEFSADDNNTAITKYWVATILVKHDFNYAYMGKHELMAMNGLKTDNNDKVSSFQWGFFDTQSNIFAHSGFVTSFLHVTQENLRPLLATQSQVSLEGNDFRGLYFLRNGKIRQIKLGDSFTAPEKVLDYRASSFPWVQIPLVIRALDLSQKVMKHFWVLHTATELKYVSASARFIDWRFINTRQGPVITDLIEVRYDREQTLPASHKFAVDRAPVEIYWRSRKANKQILRIESATYTVAGKRFHYQLDLVEELRSPWWKEDMKKRLKHMPKRAF